MIRVVLLCEEASDELSTSLKWCGFSDTIPTGSTWHKFDSFIKLSTLVQIPEMQPVSQAPSQSPPSADSHHFAS